MLTRPQKKSLRQGTFGVQAQHGPPLHRQPSLSPIPCQPKPGTGLAADSGFKFNNIPILQPKQQSNATAGQPSTVAGINAMQAGGTPLSPTVRSFMEPRFGRDFSQVRIHADSDAGRSARQINARAFTCGQHITFAEGQYQPATPSGRKLLAHELAHTVQQGNAGKYIQRYESGEHAMLGETQANLQAALAPTTYTVHKGDSLKGIAAKFGITVKALKDANKDKLKKWPAKGGKGGMVEGFNAGEIISIPQQLSDLAKAMLKDKSAKFTINGVVLDYGVGIAMGDFFESPAQMAAAPAKELQQLAILIKREQSGGKVTTDEWQKATGGRYLTLAEKNEAHFAPPDASLVKTTPAGGAAPNHKTQWEKYHTTALDKSKSGDKDKALQTNAFADHFLTDAFSAGHLINKRDVMEEFKSQLKVDPKSKEFTATSKGFFNDVAKDAFTGGVKTEFSQYETVETHYGFHPNINSVSRFSTLLQGIHMERPDILANAVAKGVHDRLNVLPGGLPVKNAKGDSWNLSGDGTLNTKTKAIARKAVAQSQLNIISVFKIGKPINYPSLFKKAWDYTPKPDKAGIKQVVENVKAGTSIKSKSLKQAVVGLIRQNYKLIIKELVKLKKLRKA